MIRSRHLFLAMLVASAPCFAHAQTANAPGGQASTGTPLDQAKSPQNNTPGTTATAPSTTNPSGTAAPKSASRKKPNRDAVDTQSNPATTDGPPSPNNPNNDAGGKAKN